MFNLFSKKSIKEDTLVLNNPKNYPQEVLEIHHEFEVASTKLLAEANLILKNSDNINKNKISRLNKLGFTKSEEVVSKTPIIKKAELSKYTINLIEYYKRNYPNNKFITEEQVKEICEKYSLVCGNVSRYTGFVPDTNLREIESFSLNKNDLPKYAVVEYINNSEKIYQINKKHLTKKGREYILNDFFYLDSMEKVSFFFTTEAIKELNIKPFNSYVQIVDNKNSLKICAPFKNMNIQGAGKISSYQINEKYKDNPVPDPVVLQPVIGGYLILTAWGDEANDPIIKNQ